MPRQRARPVLRAEADVDRWEGGLGDERVVLESSVRCQPGRDEPEEGVGHGPLQARRRRREVDDGRDGRAIVDEAERDIVARDRREGGLEFWVGRQGSLALRVDRGLDGCLAATDENLVRYGDRIPSCRIETCPTVVRGGRVSLDDL